ncbi:MAG: C4-dicarboxylic acid transporter DauA, partial [Pseudomonadota bacterium]
MLGGQHRPNAELLAQGYGNIASAAFGGMPVTGAIARTATNVRAGGTTPVAGIVHAVVILLMMVTFAPVAERVVLPAL